MKKHLLLIGGMLLVAFAFAQEKFYTDNFSKEVKELNTSLKTIGFTTVLPSSYKKYDDIVAVIDIKDEGTDDYYTLNFYYNITPVNLVPADGKMKYIIESGSDKRSDFTSLMRTDVDVEFEVYKSLEHKARTYRYQSVGVKVMGRTQDGMHWVNNAHVPKYKYEEISFTEIKLDLGEPEPNYTTDNGLFTYKKYNEGKAFPKIITHKGKDDLGVVYTYGDAEKSTTTFSIYEIEAGEIKEESFDMSGAAPEPTGSSSPEDMIKEIKLNLKKQLMKNSCYNEARSVKLDGQRISETKINEGIYEPYMLDAGQKEKGAGGKAMGNLKSIGGQFAKPSGSGDKYNKFVNSAESNLNWTSVKLGNASFEILELDLYHYDQCTSSSSSESMTLKSGEENKTQKVILFLGVVDGRLFAGSFTKDGKKNMNDEDLKFKNYIFSTFKANN